MHSIPNILAILAFFFVIAEAHITNGATHSNQKPVDKNILSKRIRIAVPGSDDSRGHGKDVFGGYYDPYYSGGPGWS
uniref:Secreted protein n=1 Tax=Phakopsora pachyrhizi TaxID=170000 RepID=A0A0S1MIC0_PHAPC